MSQKIHWFIALPLGLIIAILWFSYSRHMFASINSFGPAFGIWLIATIIIAPIAAGLIIAGIAAGAFELSRKDNKNKDQQ